MPSNYTPNYHLNQWEPEDKVLRTDFNADNAKVDEALKAEADTRADAVAALASQLSGKGNCQIYTTTYTGDGGWGADHPTRISLPGMPLMLVIVNQLCNFAILYPGMKTGSYHSPGHGGAITATWSNTGVSFYSDAAYTQMNTAISHCVIALYAKS